MATPDQNWLYFTKAQVRNAQRLLLDDLTDDYPDEADAIDAAHFLGSLSERAIIKTNLLPRIRDDIDLAWLYANEIKFSVLSSMAQLIDCYKVRIRIPDETQRDRWNAWRES